MSQPDRQPRSGLATIRRDFSSKKTTDSLPAPSLSVPKRSTLSDSLRKAIQDGVASREAEKAASHKHTLTVDPAPRPKKRRLPSSWTDSEHSSTASPHGSSQSSFYTATSTSHDDQAVHESVRPSKTVQKPDIKLSHEQRQILEIVKQKNNIFYTGSAGASQFSCLLSTANAPVCELLSPALMTSKWRLLILG